MQIADYDTLLSSIFNTTRHDQQDSLAPHTPTSQSHDVYSFPCSSNVYALIKATSSSRVFVLCSLVMEYEDIFFVLLYNKIFSEREPDMNNLTEETNFGATKQVITSRRSSSGIVLNICRCFNQHIQC
jgi:hypothetical protein